MERRLLCGISLAVRACCHDLRRRVGHTGLLQPELKHGSRELVGIAKLFEAYQSASISCPLPVSHAENMLARGRCEAE